MSLARMKPKRKDPRFPKRMFSKIAAVPRIKSPKSAQQSFTRFTVVWTDRNGIPFNTNGFFLRIYRGSTLVDTVFFDGYGVAVTDISTPIRSALTIRAYDANGVLFRTRTAPVGVTFIAIIG